MSDLKVASRPRTESHPARGWLSGLRSIRTVAVGFWTRNLRIKAWLWPGKSWSLPRGINRFIDLRKRFFNALFSDSFVDRLMSCFSNVITLQDQFQSLNSRIFDLRRQKTRINGHNVDGCGLSAPCSCVDPRASHCVRLDDGY